MAYTLITPDFKFFHSIQSPKTPYFHPEDISILLNQDGAVAVTSVGVKIKDNQMITALIGVEGQGENGEPAILENNTLKITRLDKAGRNFIALPCPPYNNNGGLFLTDLTPHDKDVENTSTTKFDIGENV